MNAALIHCNSLDEVARELGSYSDTPWGVPKVVSDAVIAGQGALAYGRSEEVAEVAFDLITSQNSLCIKHVNTDVQGERKYYEGPYVGRKIVPILVNYHRGSSEGHFKMFYQDTVKKDGSWLCLGALVDGIKGNQTFYNEDISWAGDPGRYWEMVQNPLKIERYWYIFGGNEIPAAIETAIKRRGFEFKNKTRGTIERIKIEQELEGRKILVWPPKTA